MPDSIVSVDAVDAIDNDDLDNYDLEYHKDAPPLRPDPPYSIYNGSRLQGIVAVVGLSGFMSAFSISVYYPTISDVSRDMHVSLELVNLTVTVYMIFQGITPMVWSSFADSIGRRPVFILSFFIFVLANLIMAFNNTYGGLMVLRMLQAIGSSACMSLSAATVADCVEPSRRGTYIGLITSITMVAPAIAPILCGVLSISAYGWRTVFLFLFTISVVDYVGLLLYIPETGRSIVGNGTVRPPSWYYKPILEFFFPSFNAAANLPEERSTLAPRRPIINPLKLLKLILEPDIFLILFTIGIFYAVFAGVTVGASASFAQIYNLDTLKVGLCYIPLGAGSAFGSISAGKLLDRDFRATVSKLGYGPDENEDFPLEWVRLQRMPLFLLPYTVSLVAFGWTFRESVSLAVPLVMLFFVGTGIMAVFAIVQVLVTDLYPSQSAGVNSMINIVRCFLGAASTSVIEIVRRHIGIGWTYTLLAGVCVLGFPVLLAELVFGPRYRKRRNLRRRLEQENAVAQFEKTINENNDENTDNIENEVTEKSVK
ncbi:major facilitator superfamily domain-containing protein [Lipomyces japonicus]|uniref:major facilitator superfamily domain-containing protein n=1 Tax=Lipomyces japonicus TaxID=56871 RepID=UPI0034CEC42A